MPLSEAPCITLVYVLTQGDQEPLTRRKWYRGSNMVVLLVESLRVRPRGDLAEQTSTPRLITKRL